MIVNCYWERNLPAEYKKPISCTSDSNLWEFIQDKYQKKLFAPKGELNPVTFYYNKQEESNKRSLITPIEVQNKSKMRHSIKLTKVTGDGMDVPTIKLEIKRDIHGEIKDIPEYKQKGRMLCLPKVLNGGVSAFEYLSDGISTRKHETFIFPVISRNIKEYMVSVYYYL